MVFHRYTLLLVALCFGVASGDVTTTTTTTTPVTRYYADLVASLPAQHNKCVAITGTTSGIGYWTAMATVKKGPACLIMLNRNSSRAVKAQEDMEKAAPAGVAVVTVNIDLQNTSSVREAAAGVNHIVSKFGGLDVLACNAGVMSEPDVRTHEGYDVVMQTNHLSHFLLTKLLMPSLRAAAAARGEVRVVTQTSLARGGDAPASEYYMKSAAGTLGGNGTKAAFERYHQSKQAMIAFSMALHSKFAHAKSYSNFKSLSAAPGLAATGLNTGWPQVIVDYLKEHVCMSPPDGSCSILTAMFSSSAQSGDFYEPEHLISGSPYKLISEGVPNKLAEIPRALMGEWNDAASCSDAVGAEVWGASEAALGEKFIIADLLSPLVV
mmetsp:Transcript_119069/g.289122  ORF Transcript_119069/g.289122 Transcript_119069/m.289122 type:complete len:380 (+) Transcript_119069:58-1197(+)